MQHRKVEPSRLARLTGLGVVALALLAMSAPATAAEDNFEGWFTLLDLAMSQPNSFDQQVANVFETSGTPVGTQLVIDNDDDTSYRVGAGYSFGGGLGSLRVAYWTFDNGDRQPGSLSGNVTVLPTLFGFEGFGTQYLYGTPASPLDFRAESRIEASMLDLDYVRPMSAGEKLTVNWLAGIRVATFEEDVSFFASDTITPATVAQDRHIESDAVGLRFGATAVFGFTEVFRLEGEMSFSFLQADTMSKARNFVTGAPTPDETREGSNDNVRGEIRDFDLRLVWKSGPVDYYLGYSISSWDGLVTDPAPSPGLAFTGVQGRRDNISFNSLHGGIVVRFGPGA